ncbi:MAG: hypothetical protein ACYC9K_01015 [Sulfuricaulis sp.]
MSRVKRSLLLLSFLLSPMLVYADTVTLTWDAYPNPTATMHILCGVNGGAQAEVATAPASGTATTTAKPGDSLVCSAYATLAGYTNSPPSTSVSYTVPLVLPAPVLHITSAP